MTNSKTAFWLEVKYIDSELFSAHTGKKYCQKVFNIKLICLGTGSY